VPYIFSGLKIAAPLSLAGAVIAEFVGANRGLGFLIVTHFYYLESASMFAAMLLLFLGGIGLFALISFIELKWFARYHYDGSRLGGISDV